MSVEVVTMTRQDLTRLIRETVRVTVSEFKRDRVPPIMTKAQLADYLDKTIPTVNRYMREGMPFRKIDNGYPEFHKSEIDRWLDERAKEVSGKAS